MKCLASVKLGMTREQVNALDSEQDAPVRLNASTRPVAILLRRGWSPSASLGRDAKAIEAQSGQTEGLDRNGESAVGETDLP